MKLSNTHKATVLLETYMWGLTVPRLGNDQLSPLVSGLLWALRDRTHTEAHAHFSL